MTNPYLTETLQLIRSENLGPLTFHRLLQHYPNPETIVTQWDEIKGRLKRKITLPPLPLIHTEIDNTLKFGAQFITLFDPQYPDLLKQLPDAPPVLIVKGNLDLLTQNTLGLVGARNASSHSCRLAFKIAATMGKADWVVASGLARGIDTAAHKGALETGTLAVIGGGIDNVYPEENKVLYEKISQEGLLLTEVPYGTTPQASHFPRRNRLISGLSQGLLVVEASIQSGSLITANCATEQGREVFAVPGSPMDPRCRGTNFLLKQGAILTESAQDILNVLEKRSMLHAPQQSTLFAEESPLEFSPTDVQNTLLTVLNATPLSVHTLIQETRLPADKLWPLLLDLEMSQKIERHPGDSFSKVFAS
ncbi:MAG: DNA-processing protein DprA [Alphaproteobacteria bacterium]